MMAYLRKGTALWHKRNKKEQDIVKFTPKYAQLLNQKRPELCQIVEPSSLWPYLKKYGVLDQIIVNRLKLDATQYDTVDRLIEHIERKQSWSLHAFLRSCNLTFQEQIISLIGLNSDDYDGSSVPSCGSEDLSVSDSDSNSEAAARRLSPKGSQWPYSTGSRKSASNSQIIATSSQGGLAFSIMLQNGTPVTINPGPKEKENTPPSKTTNIQTQHWTIPEGNDETTWNIQLNMEETPHKKTIVVAATPETPNHKKSLSKNSQANKVLTDILNTRLKQSRRKLEACFTDQVKEQSMKRKATAPLNIRMRIPKTKITEVPRANSSTPEKVPIPLKDKQFQWLPQPMDEPQENLTEAETYNQAGKQTTSQYTSQTTSPPYCPFRTQVQSPKTPRTTPSKSQNLQKTPSTLTEQNTAIIIVLKSIPLLEDQALSETDVDSNTTTPIKVKANIVVTSPFNTSLDLDNTTPVKNEAITTSSTHASSNSPAAQSTASQASQYIGKGMEKVKDRYQQTNKQRLEEVCNAKYENTQNKKCYTEIEEMRSGTLWSLTHAIDNLDQNVGNATIQAMLEQGYVEREHHH